MKYLRKYFQPSEIEGERDKSGVFHLFELPVIDPYKMRQTPPDQIPVHCGNCQRPFYLAPGLGRGQKYDNAVEQARAFYGSKCPGCNMKIGFRVDYIKDKPDSNPFRLYSRDVYHLKSMTYDKDVIDYIPKVDWVLEIIGGDTKLVKTDNDTVDATGDETKPESETGTETTTTTSKVDVNKLYQLYSYGNTAKCGKDQIWHPIDKKCVSKSDFVKLLNLPTYMPKEGYLMEQLGQLIQKNLRIFLAAYQKSLDTKFKSKELEIQSKLQTLEREIKTRNIPRIKDALRIWSEFITPIISLNNKKIWCDSSDGKKYSTDLGKFECFSDLLK